MNEEYLWDKRGTDSEIEGLEELLSPLRYVPVPPPGLRPAKTPAFGWLAAWITPRAGVFAATATLVFAIAIAWQGTNIRQTNEQAASNVPSVIEKERALLVPTNPDPPPPARPNDEMAVTTALHIPMQRAAKRSTVSTKRLKPRRQRDDRITKEELQAYEQVMLALSIASDKLKIVSEAANGSDE